MSAIVIFCDLDDTVFEPHAFATDSSVLGACDRIEREHLPLVLCSTKTRAEIALIQQQLGIRQPFICESGAAVFVPRDYFGVAVAQAHQIAGYEVIEFGKPYGEVVAALHHAVHRLDIQVVGFNDMSVEDVAIDCELPLLQARLAKLREYSEPIRFVDAKPGTVPKLFKALRTAGLGCMSRARYHYVGTIRRSLGELFLRRLFQQFLGGDIVTVAFGDHSSALPLLRQADVPVIVQSVGTGETQCLLADVPHAHLSTTASVGAWADLILDISAAVQRRRHSLSS